MKDDGYNGPGKDEYWEALGRYEEECFLIMRHTSLAGKILAEWESDGGEKDDLRDGKMLKNLSKEDQQTEIRRQFRVAAWHDIVNPDKMGQKSFISLFDVPDTLTGIGGAVFGSRSSIIRAKAKGFYDGKKRGGPGLQEGLEFFDWPADSDESLSYCEGYGIGLQERPPPKTKKTDGDDEPDENEQPKSALGVMVDQLKAMDAAAEAAEPKRGRGRPKRNQAALSAPDAREHDEPPPDERSVRSIWDNEPDGPIH